jgi:hypothetical protein
MKNLFIINEEEKNRILNLHETATQRHYLSEQNNQFLFSNPKDPLNTKQNSMVLQGDPGDPYQYMKFANQIWYAKKSDGKNPKWVEVKNEKAKQAIKSKIFQINPGSIPSSTKTTTKPKTTTTTVPGKSEVKTPKEEKSLFDRITGGIKQFASNMVGSVVPIHIRTFYDFLTLRKKPITLTDFSTTEQEALRQMIQYGLKHGYKSGKNFSFYDIANKLNDGSEQIDFKNKEDLGINQFALKSEYTKLSMTLGNATVTKRGDKYIVTDIYDFNNYKNNPEKYTLKELPNTVKDSIKTAISGNPVQGIEKMASYYQKLGYKGIPINIEIPA